MRKFWIFPIGARICEGNSPDQVENPQRCSWADKIKERNGGHVSEFISSSSERSTSTCSRLPRLDALSSVVLFSLRRPYSCAKFLSCLRADDSSSGLSDPS